METEVNLKLIALIFIDLEHILGRKVYDEGKMETFRKIVNELEREYNSLSDYKE